MVKTWSMLIVSDCYKLPLAKWIPALKQALARLEDSGSNVVKGALQLAIALMNKSPWGSSGAGGLDVAKLQGALNDQQAALQVRGGSGWLVERCVYWWPCWGKKATCCCLISGQQGRLHRCSSTSSSNCAAVSPDI